MVKQRFSGPKYANGNHKSQQKAYNKSKKGKSLIANAQALVASLLKRGKKKPGKNYEAGHYKNGGKTSGRWQLARTNAKSRLNRG